MKLKLLNIVLMIVGLSCTAVTHASLYMEITGGKAKGIPIAIAPFYTEQNENFENIAQIIKSDLEHSGQFKATSFETFRKIPKSIKEIDYGYWQSVGAEDLVMGRIEKTGSSKYTVSFELLDVFRQKAVNGTEAPLISMHFDNIRPENFRALAHHISDMIFEQLIGIKGIFSTRIAYVSVMRNEKGTTHTLEVADSDGYNPKPLYRSLYPLMSPSWSPDGKKIAFVSFEKDRASTNIVDVITGRVEKITQFPGINGAPTWSPDGKSLALVLSKDGSPKLYTINLSNKQLTRITSGTGIDTEPTFDPNGRSIIFTSSRGGKPQIYRVTLATGKIDRLTFTGEYNAKASLTPDGKRLVMLHRGEDGLFNVAVQTLGTGELRVLTKTSLNDSPCLAPNGMMVIYGAQEAGRGMLGAVTLDGSVKIRLPAREGDVQEPAWSPFPSNS